MEAQGVPVPLERLLEHREWIRRVARSLVSDEDLAADLEQDLWEGVIESPPLVRGSLRGWLAAALRNDLFNRRRTEARRVRRETAAARPEAEPSTADLVAEADAHRRVVNAVMELEEPYRAVILLRYFEDMPASAIASRQGIPVETVRTRIKRAIAALRGRLGAEGGTDHPALALLLAPLTRSSAPAGSNASALAKGVLIVKTTTKVAVAAAVLLTAGLAWWTLSQGTPAGPSTAVLPSTSGDVARPKEVASATPAAPESGQTPAVPPVPATSPPPAPAAVPETAPPPAPASVAEPPKPLAPPGVIAGRVLLQDRSPVDGATVTLRSKRLPAEGQQVPEPMTTSGTGEFRFDTVPVGAYEVVVSKEGFAPRTLSGISVNEGAGVEGLDAILIAGGGIEGKVTAAGGAPAAELAVRAGRQSPPGASGEATTGADGSYRIEHLLPGRYEVGVVRGEGRVQKGYVTVPEGGSVRLDFAPGASVFGVLLDSAGSPIGGASIRAYAKLSPKEIKEGSRKFTSRETKTEETGRFRLEDLDPGEWFINAQVTLGESPFAAEIARVTMDLGDKNLSIRLPSGQVAGRLFAKATGRGLGREGGSLSLYCLVQDEKGTWNLGGSAGMAFPDADGNFRFLAVGPGRYRLFANPRDPALRKCETDLALAEGEKKEGLSIGLEEARLGTVRFVVRDTAGRPVEGAAFATVVRTGPGSSTSSTLHVAEKDPGTYEARMEVGTCEVSVHREDLGTALLSITVKEGETQSFDAVLKKPEPR